MIQGDVHVWTRTVDDLSRSATFITAPAQALHLAAGDIYALSIMVNTSGGSLYLKLGQNCTISGDMFEEGRCPIIDRMNIKITHIKLAMIRTLYFNIIIDDRFIDGQANMTVTFIHIANRIQYNISGYLYFDSQPNVEDDSSTQYPRTPVQCNCPTTGSSDQETSTHCQEKVAKLVSGSNLDHVALPGMLLVAVSVLFSVTQVTL